MPISFVTRSEFGTRRTMVPLRLTWGMTIHKSQGLTLDEVSVHLGAKEDTPGQTFVAISRVKTLRSLNIHDLNRRRMAPMMANTRNSAKWPSLKETLDEIRRLRRLIVYE